ncbi:halocyanin domain protein [Halorubrum distributum JCM 9100]|uniref:Halocyanin domain protein n=4 Tax=Halorubrum distributum TaxID=29283 RepID=M0ESA8_9EURY|nr:MULTISPECIES: halocyanin domain-containing protein [Halorubrum distributum group]ELZ35910.1 halocyanin domain protein [Halorubrum terrestre JCM 10247]ELZ50681.1 halocyanin domain protein [Halorubrum distributum JCM 9100]ELZ52894.1 halocyanin domain protein [Halorubrum distributum JCM 10118]EMA71987.1 halocyanin domain protein [Halorubrum arcis JCM 13916]
MSDNLSRRRYLAGTGAALTIGTLAGCSGGGDGGDGGDGSDGSDGSGGGNAAEDVPDEIDEYLSDARMYEGTIMDFTGQDEVTVEVGAGDVGFAFSPAAIRIDSSTTVVWEWTGNGGAHNVASVEGSESDFDSGDSVSEEGHTFEQSFDNTGIQLYQCTPHQANGMLGAIEVVEA